MVSRHREMDSHRFGDVRIGFRRLASAELKRHTAEAKDSPSTDTKFNFAGVTFGLGTPELVQNAASAHIYLPGSFAQHSYVPLHENDVREYKNASAPHVTIPELGHGVCDANMGTADPNLFCKLCHSGFMHDAGHPGCIDLILPICSPKQQVLDLFCKQIDHLCPNCADIHLPDSIRKSLLAITDRNKRLDRLNELLEDVRYCGELCVTEPSTSTKKFRPPASPKTSSKTPPPAAQPPSPKTLSDTSSGSSSGSSSSDDDDDDEEKEPAVVEPDDEEGGSGIDTEDEEEEPLEEEEEEEDDEDEDRRKRRKKKRRKETTAASTPKKKRPPTKTARQKRLEELQRTTAEELADYQKDPDRLWRPSLYHPTGNRLRRGEFDAAAFERGKGCGHPLPVNQRSELDLWATYFLPWLGDASKKNWPAHNPWTVYSMCMRAGKTGAAELLGLKPMAELRGYMMTKLAVLGPNRRVPKSDGMKSNLLEEGGIQPYAAYNGIVEQRNLLLHSLLESGIAKLKVDPTVTLPASPSPAWAVQQLATGRARIVVDPSRLGSECRRVFWVKRADPSRPCLCKTARGRRCLRNGCPAGGELVECTCKNPDICVCILESLGPTSKYRAALPAKRTEPPDLEQKSWMQYYRSMCNEVITFLVGELKRKVDGQNRITFIAAGGGGGGGDPGTKAVVAAPWTQTSNACNKISKQARSLEGKQKGKAGRWRGNLSARRGDYTERAVLGPHPRLKLTEIGLPLAAARRLTLSRKVQKFNRAVLVETVRQRKVAGIRHPTDQHVGFKVKNLDSNRLQLQENDELECELENGDRGVSNRQPTLWRPSMQGAKCRILPWQTNRWNIAIYGPFGADNDGDETNWFLSRSIMGQAETDQFMSIGKQLRSQQGCQVVLGIVQNGCLASYLLTDVPRFLTYDQVLHLCGQFALDAEDEERAEIREAFYRFYVDGLPLPAIRKPRALWTGPQLVGLFLPRTFTYSKGDVHIRKGELLQGTLTHEHVGRGASAIPHVLLNDYGSLFMQRWIEGWQLIVNAWLAEHGTTLSTDQYQIRRGGKLHQLRENLVRRLEQYAMQPENQDYDTMRPNECETRLVNVQERVQEVVTAQMKQDMARRPPDEAGFHACIRSGTKGSDRHAGVMGGMRGAQLSETDGRMPGWSGHYNVTAHLPECHGFDSTSLTENSEPWVYHCQCKCSRRNMLTTSKNVPSSGYIHRCLNVILAGVAVHLDGTVRDDSGNIIQFRYGDDGFDPGFLEHVPLAFYTPAAHSDTELTTHRTKLIESLSRLYSHSELGARSTMGPIHFQRTLLRLVTTERMEGPVLTAAQCRVLRNAFLSKLAERYGPTFRENLLLRTMLLDVLSDYHVCEKLKCSGQKFAALCEHFENCIDRAIMAPSESVGLTAGQSTSEPLTQSLLKLFKSLRSTTAAALAGDMSALMSAAPDEQLKVTLNASRRESAASMVVTLQPPFNQSFYATSIACQQLPCRRLFELVSHKQIFAAGRIHDWPDEWARSMLLYQTEDVRLSVSSRPTIRLELRRSLMNTLGLRLSCICRDIRTQAKTGVHVWFRGDYDPEDSPMVLYVHFDLAHNQPHLKRVNALKGGRMTANDQAIARAALIRLTNGLVVSGIPQILAAYPVELNHYTYDATDLRNPLKKHLEWGIKTKGSNLDALIPLPFVRFEGCTTTYVHDARRLGIGAAQTCSETSIDSIVRGVSNIAPHITRLISDVMTYSGNLISYKRGGLKVMTRAPLRLASFEEIMKNIYNAAINGEHDPCTNPVSAVIVGKPCQIGTACAHVTSIPGNPPPRVESKQLTFRDSILKTVREVASYPQRSAIGVRPEEWPFFRTFLPVAETSASSFPTFVVDANVPVHQAFFVKAEPQDIASSSFNHPSATADASEFVERLMFADDIPVLRFPRDCGVDVLKGIFPAVCEVHLSTAGGAVDSPNILPPTPTTLPSTTST